MRIQQRSLRSESLTEAAETLEIIESYEQDKYLPSYLLRGEHRGIVFHTQIATDVEGGNVRVVTMYIPNAAEWDPEFRLRKERR